MRMRVRLLRLFKRFAFFHQDSCTTQPSFAVSMTVVHVLDNYYLGITAIITVAYQLFFFAIAFTLKFDKLTGTSTIIPTPSIATNIARLCRRNQLCPPSHPNPLLQRAPPCPSNSLLPLPNNLGPPPLGLPPLPHPQNRKR